MGKPHQVGPTMGIPHTAYIPTMGGTLWENTYQQVEPTKPCLVSCRRVIKVRLKQIGKDEIVLS